MARFLGAKDLGLEVSWRYRFVGHAETALPAPGVVYLDVGGSLGPGVIDHHAAQGATCASELVFRNREFVYNHLMERWLARAEEGSLRPGTVWAPTIVTHFDPDWDSVVAAFLVRQLIEYGDFPESAPALVAYARLVDQGFYMLSADSDSSLQAPHIGYLGIQNLRNAEGLPCDSEEQLARGRVLLEHVLASVLSARDGHEPTRVEELLPGAPGTGAWWENGGFADVRSLLTADRLAFEDDRRRGRFIENVLLPAADGGEPIPLRAFVADRPTKSALNKYWIRSSGAPYFVCPYATEGASTPSTGKQFPRVIISLDPTFTVDGRHPTLQGLGFKLEQLESEARRERSQGSGVRTGPPRYPDGYCDNADPWYDGRAHGGNIIDAPRSGTVLDYDTIVGTAISGDFWRIPLESGTLSLIWVEEPSTAQPETARREMAPFEGMAGILRPLCSATQESDRVNLADVAGAGAFKVREWFRFHPSGTSKPFRVIEIESRSGAVLEDLAALCRRVCAERSPDYRAARLCLGTHFSSPAHVDRLLQELGGGQLAQIDGSGIGAGVVLFGGRTLVVRDNGPGGLPFPDPDREIFLYVAFLWETLGAFSHRVAALVPAIPQGARYPRRGAQDARSLRQDFLRFQSVYYQLEVSHSFRGRFLFAEFTRALGVVELYHELQSELDRLNEIEERAAEARRAQAEGVLSATLYFLAVAGLLQTVVAFLAWEGRGPGMWLWIMPILAVAVVIYVWVRRMHQDR
jgi:hypothetical protein